MEKQVKIKLTNSILALWCLGIIYAAFNLQKVSDVAIDALRPASIFISTSALIYFNYSFYIKEDRWVDAFFPSFLLLLIISLLALSQAADLFFCTAVGLIFCLIYLPNESR